MSSFLKVEDTSSEITERKMSAHLGELIESDGLLKQAFVLGF